MSNKFSINDLSTHLFWDLDKGNMNFVESKNTIIHRVLEYGNLRDWEMIKEIYGLDEIKNASLAFRSLDPVTLSFLSQYFKLDKSVFRCYSNMQSPQNFWNT